MGKWAASCGWADGSPNAACLSAARRGRALSAAEASGLSCESSPPPETKRKETMAAEQRNTDDSRQRRHSRTTHRNQSREFSEITP